MKHNDVCVCVCEMITALWISMPVCVSVIRQQTLWKSAPELCSSLPGKVGFVSVCLWQTRAKCCRVSAQNHCRERSLEKHDCGVTLSEDACKCTDVSMGAGFEPDSVYIENKLNKWRFGLWKHEPQNEEDVFLVKAKVMKVPDLWVKPLIIQTFDGDFRFVCTVRAWRHHWSHRRSALLKNVCAYASCTHAWCFVYTKY